MGIRVSVIMSVFNAAKFLDGSIQSLLNQTFTHFELLIINDNSTDNSPLIIEKYANQDTRIKVIHNSSNYGRVKSRNIGLDNSKGEYIAILDADDQALPERLEKQVIFLDNNPEIFLLGTGAYRIDENGNVIGYHKPITNEEKVASTLTRSNCIYHSSILFRRTKIRYREKFPLSQDYDFYLQLLRAGKKLTNLKEKLILYRISANAASWTNTAKQKLFAQKALEFHLDEKNGNYTSYNFFNPLTILNLDLTNSTERIVLETEIEKLYKFSSFTKLREECKKYFSHYGYNNKFLLIYILSFFGTKMNNFLRKYF
jgi:glycosyltransferase involved in cell wall biosynthesis